MSNQPSLSEYNGSFLKVYNKRIFFIDLLNIILKYTLFIYVIKRIVNFKLDFQ